MSAIVDGHEFLRRLSPQTQPVGSGAASTSSKGRVELIRIGLVNNMPDSAVVRTERQFVNLLRSSANGMRVQVKLYSLPAIPRAGTAQEHIKSTYEPIDALWDDELDAIVVTGTEPRERNLKDELFWSALAGLIDGIDAQGIPAMFSCLAAHAAVLQVDGVPRAALADKCFGVFEDDVAVDHPLMDRAGARMWLPHTRWNEVTEAELVKAGYQILSWSRAAGVSFFAKERRSLWLLCQGHPEYDGANLLREYRRDVSRFLSRERASYPELPRSYFGEPETRILRAFKDEALAQGDATIMDAFPRIVQGSPTWDAWGPGATSVFGNWLKYVGAARVSPYAARSDDKSSKASPVVPDYIGDQYLTGRAVEPLSAPLDEGWRP
jgi:homoserine O-succinyltransferase/O-acetyltransferase